MAAVREKYGIVETDPSANTTATDRAAASQPPQESGPAKAEAEAAAAEPDDAAAERVAETASSPEESQVASLVSSGYQPRRGWMDSPEVSVDLPFAVLSEARPRARVYPTFVSEEEAVRAVHAIAGVGCARAPCALPRPHALPRAGCADDRR